MAFNKCKSYGIINGDNTGGICGGGNNVQYKMNNIGGGCIGNLNVINMQHSSTINFLVSVKFTKCKSKSPATGFNSGGICGGGTYISAINQSYAMTGTCIGSNNSAIEPGFGGKYTGGIVVDMTNCKSSGYITGIGNGGLCAIGIGYYDNNHTNNHVSLAMSILSCECTGDQIGRKHVPKPILNTYCGGILAGYVNGSMTDINISITNCYTTGYIGSTCAGICGQGDTSTVGPHVTINNCYTSGNKSKYGFYISDPTQMSTVETTYMHETLNEITGKLGNLPEQYWEKHSNSLPTLKC